MANEVNLSPASVVRAAINTTLNNGVKFTQIGALQAVRSPQLADLTKEMSPAKAKADNRLSWQPGAGRHDAIPTVRLNYRQQYSTNSTTNTRTVDTSGSRPRTATEVDVTYNNYKQYNLEFVTLDFEKLEPAAKQYYATENAANGVVMGNAEIDALSEIGNEFLKTVEKDFLMPMSNIVLSALITAIGTNNVTKSNVAKSIVLYGTDGRIRKDLFKYLNSVRTAHGVTGRWILLGGLTLVNFMAEADIISINDAGLDAKAMFEKLNIEWYYDPSVDVLLGQDKILVIEPGSSAMQTILEHGAFGPVKQKEVANTTFGTGSIAISQFSSPTYQLPFDIRVRAYDTEKYPYWVVTPSSGLFGMFTRPAGFLKNYDGWGTYTGIFAIQLLEREPATP